jgi:hypothetical protein
MQDPIPVVKVDQTGDEYIGTTISFLRAYIIVTKI